MNNFDKIDSAFAGGPGQFQTSFAGAGLQGQTGASHGQYRTASMPTNLFANEPLRVKLNPSERGFYSNMYS